jgi:hypothetical protein
MNLEDVEKRIDSLIDLFRQDFNLLLANRELLAQLARPGKDRQLLAIDGDKKLRQRVTDFMATLYNQTHKEVRSIAERALENYFFHFLVTNSTSLMRLAVAADLERAHSGAIPTFFEATVEVVRQELGDCGVDQYLSQALYPVIQENADAFRRCRRRWRIHLEVPIHQRCDSGEPNVRLRAELIAAGVKVDGLMFHWLNGHGEQIVMLCAFADGTPVLAIFAPQRKKAWKLMRPEIAAYYNVTLKASKLRSVGRR